MIINTRFRAKQGSLYLYALCRLDVFEKAAEATFLQLGWNVKKNKNGAYFYYPGGWIDRASSAYTRSVALTGSGYYGTDNLAIIPHETNNPLVILVEVYVYLKIGWFNKDKIAKNTDAFYESFSYECKKYEIPLIGDERWSALVSAHPEVHCSPVWGQSKRGIFEPIPAPGQKYS